MRALLCLLVFVMGCDAGRSTPMEPAPRPALEARHGGAIITVDRHTIEVVVHESGETHAHVRSTVDLSAQALTVVASDADGSHRTIAMRWADPIQGFVGQADRPLAPGPVQVLLVRGDNLSSGEGELAAVIPAPAHGGSMLALGDNMVEVLVDADGGAQLYQRTEGGTLEGEMTLLVPDEGGALHPLPMNWNAEASRYEGALEGLSPRAGPIEIILVNHGEQVLAYGTLGAVGAGAVGAEGEPDFRLEMPQLGAAVPAAIPVPPSAAQEGAEGAAAGAPGGDEGGEAE